MASPPVFARLDPTKNSRNIPELVFFENAADFLGGTHPNLAIASINTLYEKYKIMEIGIEDSQQKMEKQLEDLENTIAAVSRIKEKVEASTEPVVMDTYFKMLHTVYVKARITLDKSSPPKIMLWMGANVAVDMEIDEAIKLVTENAATVRSSIVTLNTDLDFLRDQITTAEVALSRLHNYAVHLKNTGRLPPMPQLTKSAAS